MFFRKKSQASVSPESALSLVEILGCDELETPESRLQRATFLDLFRAQSEAQWERWKGNAAASGALILLYHEAVNRDLEHRYLLEEMLLMKQSTTGGLFEAYGRSKELSGEERVSELSALSSECRNWISAVMIINRAVQQDLRFERGRKEDDC
jgi:hypothetical protein